MPAPASAAAHGQAAPPPPLTPPAVTGAVPPPTSHSPYGPYQPYQGAAPTGARPPYPAQPGYAPYPPAPYPPYGPAYPPGQPSAPGAPAYQWPGSVYAISLSLSTCATARPATTDERARAAGLPTGADRSRVSKSGLSVSRVSLSTAVHGVSIPHGGRQAP